MPDLTSAEQPARRVNKRVLIVIGAVFVAIVAGIGGFLVYSVVRVQGRLAVHEKEAAVQSLIVVLLDAQAASFRGTGRFATAAELRDRNLVRGDINELVGAHEYSVQLNVDNNEGTFQIRASPHEKLYRALHYYADQTCEIRCNQNRPARKSDPLIGEAVLDF